MSENAHRSARDSVDEGTGYAAIAASLGTAWESLCSKYLPVQQENSLWRYNRPLKPDDPEQGWKLHISATVLTACRVLERVAPVLSNSGVLFKATSSLEELARLNCGLFYGFSQIGKFITVYPRSAEDAVYLAHRLHRLTSKLSGPSVAFDMPLARTGCIYYRYGAFRSLRVETSDGSVTPAIRDLEGKLVPDLREPGFAIPSWTIDPFPLRSRRDNKSLSASSPLGTTFLAYEALSQRGKGGVYRALDLSVIPAQLCILKEGRKHGETDWHGRDGRWRVRHEAKVLTSLSTTGVGVPKVLATFEVDQNYYLVTEFIEGKTLQSVLTSSRQKLPLVESLGYAIQLANLMHRVHSAGWVWRDCKPMNIVITKEGILRPLDFEGACRVDSPDQTPWGTVGYISPHRLSKGSIGSRVPDDLYALGATIHQLFTSRAPNSTDPPPIGKLRRQVPRVVKKIVAALVGPDPMSRPCAREVGETLESASQQHHS